MQSLIRLPRVQKFKPQCINFKVDDYMQVVLLMQKIISYMQVVLLMQNINACSIVPSFVKSLCLGRGLSNVVITCVQSL